MLEKEVAKPCLVPSAGREGNGAKDDIRGNIGPLWTGQND
jgi:hypothetical protein